VEEATKIESHCTVLMPNAICLVNYSLSNDIIDLLIGSIPHPMWKWRTVEPLFMDPFPYQGSRPSSLILPPKIGKDMAQGCLN